MGAVKESPDAFDLPWLTALRDASQRGVPFWLLWPARLLPPLTLGSIAAFTANLLPPYFMLTLPAQFFLFLAVHFRTGKRAALFAHAADQISRFEELFAVAASLPLRSEPLHRMHDTFREAAPAIRRLSWLGGFFTIRKNPILHLLAGLFFIHEAHLLESLRLWIQRHGAHVEFWFEELGELDAWISLAEYAHDNPECVYPALAGEGDLIAASELAHPLLPAKNRVANSFRFPDTEKFWVITGSNMSGKSTFLRTVGVSLLFAMAGLPVPARSFAFRPLRIVTSMRHRDDTQHSISLFYDEVRRIVRIMREAEARGTPLFFLIDEMLRGTNSRERIIASRSILLQLAKRNAAGLVATHDMELVELCQSGKGVRCFHFEETVVEEKMSFDYKLKDGPVHSSNALRILEMEGIRIHGADERG